MGKEKVMVWYMVKYLEVQGASFWLAIIYEDRVVIP